MSEVVLIIDDDQKLRHLLSEYLEGYGYEVKTLSDGLQATNVLQDQAVDIVVLDVMMPKKDGFEVLQDIRRISKVPVIMLTAKGDDADRIVGLEMGADDYLAKPFNPRELLARIKAVLRRMVFDKTQVQGSVDQMYIRAGGVVLNTVDQTVWVDDNKVELSYTEYQILKVLMQRPNTVLSRDQLMSLARGKDFMAFDRSIDVHISKLRAKIEIDPSCPKRIKTIWGTGYLFVDMQ